MKGITKEEATRTSTTGPLGFIEILTSMPLSGKLVLLVIIALIPRIIVFLQPQIITNDRMLYIKMAKLFSEGQYGGTPGFYFSLYPFLIRSTAPNPDF